MEQGRGLEPRALQPGTHGRGSRGPLASHRKPQVSGHCHALCRLRGARGGPPCRTGLRGSGPPDCRDGPVPALPGHGQPQVSGRGQVLPRLPWKDRNQERLLPEPPARAPAGRGCGPCRAGHLHVCRHGRRGRPHGRHGLYPRHRPHLGQHRGPQALHHRRHRGHQQRRGFRQELRTAQHERLQRDLRRHWQRLRQLPALPASRRKQVLRRAGTHALQRAHRRRVDGRRRLLLPQSAGEHGPAPASGMVRLRLLSEQCVPLPAVASGLCLCRSRP